MKPQVLSKEAFFDNPNWMLALVECDFVKTTNFTLSSPELTCMCRMVPQIISNDSLDL